MSVDINQPSTFQKMVNCTSNDGFRAWINHLGGSVMVSTYQANKLAFIGWDGRQVTLTMRDFDKPMGVAYHNDQILLASRREITLFSNAKVLAYEYDTKNIGSYDACYLPRTKWYTGDLNVHDVLFDSQGILMVNTRFSCLARPSFRFHFSPVWQPPFITDIVPEDRCHLNGVTLVDGQPAYVTMLGATDTARGWSEKKLSGGVLMDIRTNEVVLEGLCLPHSPRFYRQNLWFLNSGEGELWVVNPRTKENKVVVRLPGYLRGLDFWRDFAIIGLSKIRKHHQISGLPVQKTQNLLCGVAVVNVLTGNLEGFFEFTEGCEEIYDVRLLPGARHAAILTPELPTCHEAITTENSSWWLRSHEVNHEK
ncbi:MAG: TIGR03032 family protein [Planctomycetia bacterium]|nr:TIGR03032 family protein [Planctomycetia bacterium]